MAHQVGKTFPIFPTLIEYARARRCCWTRTETKVKALKPKGDMYGGAGLDSVAAVSAVLVQEVKASRHLWTDLA